MQAGRGGGMMPPRRPHPPHFPSPPRTAMADGTFDTTGSGLYTPEAPPAEEAVSDEQLLAQYRRQFEQVAGEYPTGSVLTALGIGVGLGAAVGFALGRALREDATDETELIGRRLLAAVRDVVPDGVAKYLD